MKFIPVDQAARDRAQHEHGTSFVLEAGAGTGKTTLLVERCVSLLASGHATLDQIAAVTFTENAATTLKFRLRERLERVRAEGEAGAAEASARALDVLERAAISTLHAFCAALLEERPLECGVVPGFRVADEAEMDLLFAEAWDEWIATVLTQGDDAILAALEADIPLAGRTEYEERQSLRGLARNLIEQRDLVPLVSASRLEAGAWRDELVARLAGADEIIAAADASDSLAARFPALAEYALAARGLSGEPLRRHRDQLDGVLKGLTSRSGDKRAWQKDAALAEAREIVRWALSSADEWKAAKSAALHAQLVGALAGVGALYARKKTERGVLDFLDLLQKALAALESKPSVRRYFARRYPFLIIDEFQDTDPLQARIAELLTDGRAGALVVVGDPKQSIYRFRRADVRLFTRAAARATAGAGGPAVLRLTQNFRSRGSILRFVNRVFASVITRDDAAGQPAYEPIAPPPGLSDLPSVVALRYDAGGDEDLGSAETRALARLLQEIARGGFEVRDPASGRPRPSRPGDVMALSRRLTQVHHLENALETIGLRFVTEGGKSFFDRQEVHELLAVVRAIDDPADRTALVGALRSSFFGVSDRDIACYVLAGGYLRIGDVDADRPGAAAMGPALALLSELHAQRRRASPAAILERLYDETRVLAALTGTRRGEAQAANLEKVVAMARQSESLGVLTLRGFAGFVEARIRERSDEPDLPLGRPGDPETVRVLTIHKAKGLESPIVILFDGADNAWSPSSSVALWEDGRIAIGFRKGCQPPGWEAIRTADEDRGKAEQKRLLYVACTRARDYLVVPVPPEGLLAGEFWKPLVSRLPERSDEDVRVVDAATLREPEPRTAGIDLRELAGAEGGDPVALTWETERQDTIARASVRMYKPIAATTAALRVAPPSALVFSGREGRAFGALVHRILEWLPLDAPGAARPMAEALAARFGLPPAAAERAADSIVRTLALPLMERARRAERVFRELPIWLPQEGELIEGIVDLAFEEEGRLVVVDYKTDAVSEEQVLEQAAHHAEQLRLYDRALALATGAGVRERYVLFTSLPRAVAV